MYEIQEIVEEMSLFLDFYQIYTGKNMVFTFLGAQCNTKLYVLFIAHRPVINICASVAVE